MIEGSSPEWIWLWGLAFSIGGITLLFPIAAAILAWLRGGAPKLPPAGAPVRLEVLIPAYNEEGTIGRTIESVLHAGQRLLKLRPNAQVRVTVALDGPTDSTGRIVAQLVERNQDSAIPVKMLDRGANRGKWATIGELLGQSQGSWSALVDAGTLWPEDFLEKVADRLERSECVGIAPGYRHSTGGWVSRAIWWQERFLKSIENLGGGPFTLHGATMLFRTREIREAFESLNTRAWLNDDVVLGLFVRCKGRIDYLGDGLCVGDCGVKEGAGERGRRKRMIMGNVEWIQALFPRTLREAPEVGLLALRRIMRVFWAYQAILAVFSLGMVAGLGALRSLGFVALLVLVAALSRTLREAGALSLAAPVLALKKGTSVRWS